METFEFTNIVVIAIAGIGLILGAVLHHRALRKALAGNQKHHVRGLRRYRL